MSVNVVISSKSYNYKMVLFVFSVKYLNRFKGFTIHSKCLYECNNNVLYEGRVLKHLEDTCSQQAAGEMGADTAA